MFLSNNKNKYKENNSNMFSSDVVLNALFIDKKIVVNKIIDIFNNKGYKFFERGNYNLNIIGIRNKKINEVNKHKFNDVILLMFKDVFNNWRVLIFNATTDPGLYYHLNLLNPKGTAILKEGQYRGVYKIGKFNGEECLKQNAPMVVYRDRNKDNIFDFENEDVGKFGIHIHTTNNYYYDDIGKWSGGCQVINNEYQFDLFMKICKIAMKNYGNSFSYTLINTDDFE